MPLAKYKHGPKGVEGGTTPRYTIQTPSRDDHLFLLAHARYRLSRDVQQISDDLWRGEGQPLGRTEVVEARGLEQSTKYERLRRRRVHHIVSVGRWEDPSISCLERISATDTYLIAEQRAHLEVKRPRRTRACEGSSATVPADDV